MKIKLTGKINKDENGIFIAYCPELEVDSFGDTVEEAKQSLLKAIDLYLKTAERIGLLPTIVKQLKKEISTPQEIYREYRKNDYLSYLSIPA